MGGVYRYFAHGIHPDFPYKIHGAEEIETEDALVPGLSRALMDAQLAVNAAFPEHVGRLLESGDLERALGEADNIGKLEYRASGSIELAALACEQELERLAGVPGEFEHGE